MGAAHISTRIGTVAFALALMIGMSMTALGAEQPQPQAAVFSFLDPADDPGRMVGRRAADAVFAVLSDEGPWELVSRGTVERLCEAAGVQPPFAVGYLQMLGQQTAAPLAVTGIVEICEVNSQRGTAQVTLLVELVETMDGASLASHRGIGSARRGADEAAPIDEIVDRALTEAALDAVRKLTTFDAASAMVAAMLPDGRVLLDGPEEPPLRVGSKLLIYRRSGAGHDVVGAVEVRESRLTVVHAAPLAGEDFRQGDIAVLVAR